MNTLIKTAAVVASLMAATAEAGQADQAEELVIAGSIVGSIWNACGFGLTDIGHEMLVASIDLGALDEELWQLGQTTATTQWARMEAAPKGVKGFCLMAQLSQDFDMFYTKEAN